MYHTVMKLIEANPEIRVLHAGAIIEEKKARSSDTRKHSKTRFEDVYYQDLLDKNAYSDRVVEITSGDALLWCEGAGYKPSSASSLTSLMVKRGYLAKTGVRGIFRLLRTPAPPRESDAQ
jgi:hypothetical protein